MELRHIFEILWRRKWIAIIIFAAFFLTILRRFNNSVDQPLILWTRGRDNFHGDMVGGAYLDEGFYAGLSSQR